MTGKMTGAWTKYQIVPSAITLDSTSVIALAQATKRNPPPVILPDVIPCGVRRGPHYTNVYSTLHMVYAETVSTATKDLY